MQRKKLEQRIRQAIYHLKRRYSGSITIYSLIGDTADIETGDATHEMTTVDIKRAVVLPVSMKRESSQDISVISANKYFAYGGHFDVGRRKFIIDRRDAPGLTLDENDWIVFKRKKYEIESVKDFGPRTAWVVIGKELVGEKFNQIHTLAVDHFIAVGDSVT